MKLSLVIAACVAAAPHVCAAQADSLELFARGALSPPDAGVSFGTLSPDGKEFYYTVHPADWSRHRVVVSRLDGVNWSTPETLPFSGRWNDREPRLTPDGRRLYFSSNRPVQASDTARRRDLDLWITPRATEGTWGPDIA